MAEQWAQDRGWNSPGKVAEAAPKFCRFRNRAVLCSGMPMCSDPRPPSTQGRRLTTPVAAQRTQDISRAAESQPWNSPGRVSAAGPKVCRFRNRAVLCS
jgi:hypothetical protein